MIRQAFISNGVAYHHGLSQPGELLDGFETVDLGRLAEVDLNAYDLVLAPRSADGDALRARRHQFARFLDRGGVLIAFGELWTDWFPGCQWLEECADDTREPVVVSSHPLVAPFSNHDLHWHPARERWCCHGHLAAPAGAEVLVRNQRGDPWLYIDRTTTNGVIVASTNLDPDTHAYHGNPIARAFFENLLRWARAEAAGTADRRQRQKPKIAGLFSGVHFQRAFYDDHEFGGDFAVLPVWELAATDLHTYAALWIPRESNQNVLFAQREKLASYLENGGTIVCFDEVNQAWLPRGTWELRPVDMETISVARRPMVAHLTADQVRWHSHGAYDVYPGATPLIVDANENVLLFIDDAHFAGTLIAGTIDPDCHVGFGAEITRPLLRAIVAWVLHPQTAVAVAG